MTMINVDVDETLFLTPTPHIQTTINLFLFGVESWSMALCIVCSL